uniref:Sleeping Beauty transposase HTH domain-containing protein n=1 Tax=Oryzias sinensis TaxID=183150 RepID=A0A8C8DMZ6_9TELE
MVPYAKEMSQNLRNEIIYLHKKIEGYKKISKSLHISQNTIAKVFKKFKKDGSTTISWRRPGCPRKLTSPQCLRMRRVEENHHASSLQLAKAVESQTGGTFSCDVIRHTLKRLLKPMHKKACLQFAKAHTEKTEGYWDSHGSDERKIKGLGTKGFKTVWRQKGEDFKENDCPPQIITIHVFMFYWQQHGTEFHSSCLITTKKDASDRSLPVVLCRVEQLNEALCGLLPSSGRRVKW